jgi:hypothetical protein
MTMSCICVVFEKQMVLRTKRLMRVRKVRCLRSIFCVLRARAMHVGVQMPSVCAPMIGVVAGQPEGVEQCLELQKDLVHLPDIMPPKVETFTR